MRKYYKKFFLLNLLIFLITGYRISNCGLNNSGVITVSHSDENVKETFKQKLMSIPLKKIAFRYAVFFTVMGVTYHITKAYKEWTIERSLSKLEQELFWHESLLSFLIANILVGDLICCSPKDKKSCEKQDASEVIAC